MLNMKVPERLLSGGAGFKDRNRRRMSLPASCRYLDTAAKKSQDSRRSSVSSISSSCKNYFDSCLMGSFVKPSISHCMCRQ